MLLPLIMSTTRKSKQDTLRETDLFMTETLKFIRLITNMNSVFIVEFIKVSTTFGSTIQNSFQDLMMEMEPCSLPGKWYFSH